MTEETDVIYELSKARASMRTWLQIQSVLRWVFLVSVVGIIFMILTERQGKLMEILVMAGTLSFIVLLISFFVTVTLASKLKKLIKMIKTPSPIPPDEATE